MRHIVTLLWCIFCVAGGVYLYVGQQRSIWWVWMGVILAMLWQNTTTTKTKD